ncbi:MAG: hypothetical protein HQL70_10135 [Magnetococcales bacterium]|nr:hypothetical protein [Magnetococcales bacterium]
MPHSTQIDKSKLNNILSNKNLLTTRTASTLVETTEYIYVGQADPGSSEANPVWLIQRTAIFADGSTATLFVDGKLSFNQIWDNRAALTYS